MNSVPHLLFTFSRASFQSMAQRKAQLEPPREPCTGDCERPSLIRRLAYKRLEHRESIHKARSCIGRLVEYIGEDNLPDELRQEAQAQIDALIESLQAIHNAQAESDDAASD